MILFVAYILPNNSYMRISDLFASQHLHPVICFTSIFAFVCCVRLSQPCYQVPFFPPPRNKDRPWERGFVFHAWRISRNESLSLNLKKKLGPRKQDHTLMKSNIPSETKLRNMVFSAFSEYLEKRFLYSLPTLIVGSRST